MKIVLVYEEIFSLSCPRGVRQEFRDSSPKNRFLVTWYPNFTVYFHDLSVFPRSYWLAHKKNVKFMYIMAFCCCTSPKTLVKIQATGLERKTKCPKKQGQSSFTRTQVSLFMNMRTVSDCLCRRSLFTDQHPYCLHYQIFKFDIDIFRN